MQNRIQNISFDELGQRELLKCSAVWWGGLVIAVISAAVAYREATPCK